jgi:hypothetical protein
MVAAIWNNFLTLSAAEEDAEPEAYHVGPFYPTDTVFGNEGEETGLDYSGW